MCFEGKKCFGPRRYSLKADKGQRVDHGLNTECPLCVEIRDQVTKELYTLPWQYIDCNSIEITSCCAVNVLVTIGACEKGPQQKKPCGMGSGCGQKPPCTCGKKSMGR